MGKFKKFPVILIVFLLLGTLVFAGGPKAKMKIEDTSSRVSPRLPYAAGEALVKFKKGMTVNALNQLAAQNGMVVKKRFAVLSKLKGQEYALLKSSVVDTAGMMNVLRNNAAVEAVSPNNLNQVAAVPNDPYYAPYMWGLNNTTQTGGTADADIDAPEAWDINTGSANNIVAVIDTGFVYTHPDLAANAWSNAAEQAGVTGVDDDGNGYVDDIYGIDPAGTDGFTPDTDPMDGYGHGTHCAGTIGAAGNNSLGIVGVNWNVKIMGLKFFDEAGGNGWDSYAIECIEYILFQKLYRGRNIVAVNASWGSNSFDQALYDAVAALGDAGIVFCAAAGNGGTDSIGDDNDGAAAHYPSSYDLPNIIAVAATDHDDVIADFSNYGATSVDLGAPGSGILSTVPKWYKPQAGDLFFDDMESGVGNWVHGGTLDTWAITTTLDPIFVNASFPVPSPPNFWADSPGINYTALTDSWLAYNADIDLSSYVGTDVYFGIGSAMYFEMGWDSGIVEFSNDSGVTWTPIYDFSYDAYYWSQWSWVIPDSFKTAHFRMRFHLISDDIINRPGWNIDNIGIGVANQYYDSWDGTSMACPHVAGAVALMAAEFPSESMADRINRILSTVDANASLAGLCTTGGRLNLYNAITYSPAATTLTVVSPNGGEEWTIGSVHNITWTSTGDFEDVDIEYSANNGASWIPVANGTANDGSYAWTVPVPASTDCLVRVSDEDDGDPSDASDSVFTILAAGTETISAPEQPQGPGTGTSGSSYDFSTKGSESSMGIGHLLQYKFDWNDGTDSGWINAGTINTPASHSWAVSGTYNVRAMARCAQHTDIESLWSAVHPIVINDSSLGFYNSPASRLLFPEVNWVGANGGGMWVTELQLVDVFGGSTVRAYYSYGANRFGPITIWTNSGAANSSITFSNILQTMDNLDPSAAVYSGTGGSLELLTQDGSHLIQAASRSYNGNSSCTFPALQDIETNSAAVGRSLVVPNISNNASYRAKVMLVNSTSSSATVEVKIIGSNGSQVGSTITRTLAEYEMLPLVNELRVDTYNNATVRIDVTSGSGRVLASGQTSNNVTNDPAAHIAVQTGTGFANSPSNRLLFPEVNWVVANNGGMWVTEMQIVDVSGGSTVQAYYSYGTNRFGPITIWTNSGAANSSISFSNILQTMDSLDPSAAVYSGTGGSLELMTQDGSHLIQVASRSYNGNSSCTFPALQDVNDHTAAIGRSLMLPNISNNTAYRAKVMLVNTTSSSATVEVSIIGSNGSQVGSTISRTLAGYEMLPLVNEMRVDTYSNAAVRVAVTSGSGRVMASGQTTNNVTNDPAAHIAVQAQ